MAAGMAATGPNDGPGDADLHAGRRIRPQCIRRPMRPRIADDRGGGPVVVASAARRAIGRRRPEVPGSDAEPGPGTTDPARGPVSRLGRAVCERRVLAGRLSWGGHPACHSGGLRGPPGPPGRACGRPTRQPVGDSRACAGRIGSRRHRQAPGRGWAAGSNGQDAVPYRSSGTVPHRASSPAGRSRSGRTSAGGAGARWERVQWR